ncbi:MAG: hypothetical protein OEQ18_04960 [Gammaproteobacteria bacterium]|nr:hypothetical protein [Gammaproteobacteria bacterium]
MIRSKVNVIALIIVALSLVTGCSKKAVLGGAAGAAAVGGAYEYQNKRALQDLDNEFKAGKISSEEYERRKREIEKRSVVY